MDNCCSMCGRQYEAGARFCGIDGTTLNNANSSSTAFAVNIKSKICPSCQSIYPGYAVFCSEDAEKLLDLPNPSELMEPVSGLASGTVKDLINNLADKDLSLVENASSNFIGKTVADKYMIEALLNQGGMAQLYLAFHLGLEKHVAIKVMHAHLPATQNAVKRFEQECKVSAKISHPNVVSVFDSGVLNNKQLYLVMEYIKGESLRSKIAREGPLPYTVLSTIIMQALAGLQEAHSEGIVHRDLKPENIMLHERSDRPDWVKIVDFGIANLKQGGQKLTGTGIALGTVDYMSPEYLSDKPIDHRADLYAMGIILFELLTGRCPFQSEAPEATMAKHLWSTALPPSYYRDSLKPGCVFDQIVEKALEKEPDRRYQSAHEMKLVVQEAVCV